MIQYKIRLLSIFVIVFQSFYDVLKFRKTMLAAIHYLKFKVYIFLCHEMFEFHYVVLVSQIYLK